MFIGPSKGSILPCVRNATRHSGGFTCVGLSMSKTVSEHMARIAQPGSTAKVGRHGEEKEPVVFQIYRVGKLEAEVCLPAVGVEVNAVGVEVNAVVGAKAAVTLTLAREVAASAVAVAVILATTLPKILPAARKVGATLAQQVTEAATAATLAREVIATATAATLPRMARKVTVAATAATLAREVIATATAVTLPRMAR